MKNKIKFLSNLNRELKKVEKEIIERALVCLETGENIIKNKDSFTSDYEVKVKVSYYLKNEYVPAYIFHNRFDYDAAVNNQVYDKLGEVSGVTDWRESYMPVIDEPYCYLLHNLLDHYDFCQNDTIFQIEKIWTNVIYSNHKGMKVNKDGTCKKLDYNYSKSEFK